MALVKNTINNEFSRKISHFGVIKADLKKGEVEGILLYTELQMCKMLQLDRKTLSNCVRDGLIDTFSLYDGIRERIYYLHPNYKAAVREGNKLTGESK